MCNHLSRLLAKPTATHYDVIRNDRYAGIIQARRAGLAGRERQGAAVLLLCSGEMMEAMLASGIDFAIFFYNSNIHPLKEYELRKDENIHFAGIFGIPFIDATTTATTGSCEPKA